MEKNLAHIEKRLSKDSIYCDVTGITFGLVGGGESSSVTFPAPEKGTYDYICTFPGHYAIMRGILVVE